MKIDYKHSLTAEEAYKKIDDLLPTLEKRYSSQIRNPQTSWNEDNTQMDFSLDIMGATTTGQVYLKDSQVILEGKLPLRLKVFSGTIEGLILKQLKYLFS